MHAMLCKKENKKQFEFKNEMLNSCFEMYAVFSKIAVNHDQEPKSMHPIQRTLITNAVHFQIHRLI